MKTLKTLLLIPIVLLGAACAPKTRTVETPKSALEAVQPRQFDIMTINKTRFVDIKLFLWKKDMESHHVKKALEVSKEIDRLNDEAFPWNRKAVEIQTEMERIGKGMEETGASLETNGKLLEEVSARLATASEELAKEEAKPEAEKNIKLIAELTAEVAAKTKQVTDITDLMGKLQTSFEDLQNSLDKLSNEEMPKVQDKIQEYTDRGSAQIEELQKVVTWFPNQPSSIAFEVIENLAFSGGKRRSIRVSVSGWDTDDGQGMKNYSTKMGTASEVSYDENGGKIEFTVQTSQTETYSFKLNRSNYDDPLGRVMFKGSLTYRKYEDSSLTRIVDELSGVAKFIDKIN